MAVKNQPLIADTGSQEVRLTREQSNLVVTWIDAFKTAVAAAADFGAFKTAVAALDTSGLRKLTAMPKGIPNQPHFPTT